MWVCQEVQRGIFQVKYLQTGLMPADRLTKILPRHKFSAFVKLLGLTNRFEDADCLEVEGNQKHQPWSVDCLDDDVVKDTTNH